MLTEPGAKAGTWMIVEDDSQITFRFDPSGRSVEFVFFGQCELSVGMSASVVRRCQDLFSQASAQLGCAQQVNDGA